MPKKKRIAEPYAPKLENIFKLPTIYTEKLGFLREQYKGQVKLDLVSFPKQLGEKHPFSYEEAKKIYSNCGLAKACVDKHLDFILSKGFHVTSKNKKAEVLINQIIRDIGFDQTMRGWILDALIKGVGFMEVVITKDEVKLRVINANNMYVKRDKNGNISKYNQYVGDFDRFSKESVIEFEPDEIAQLNINAVSDSPYGLGLIYPAMKTLDSLLRGERDLHMIMSRKANNPIIANVGTPEEPATAGDVAMIGQKFEYLNNLHEWAFDHKVDIKALDFGNIGEKFSFVLEHDVEMTFFVFQVPSALMGKANISQGIGKVDADAWERRIESLQASVEQVVEEKIFKVILKNNNNFGEMDSHVEMEWGLPSEESIDRRILSLTTLLSNGMLSPQLRAQIEIDLATILGYEEMINMMLKPAMDMQTEIDAEANLKEPEVPGEKPSSSELFKNIVEKRFSNKIINEAWEEKELEQLSEMSIQEFVRVNELDGFNFVQYIRHILEKINNYHFNDLNDLAENQIIQLRSTLKEGFTNNQSLRQIEINIRDNLQIDEMRANRIARTETVRLSNMGLISMYGENGIGKVRWLASISDRTCPVCEALDGMVFTLQESMQEENHPPKHPMCRCALVGIKE